MKHDLSPNQLAIFYMAILLSGMIFFQCAGEKGAEISDHKDKISCRYLGLRVEEDATIVDLAFKNQTGKVINTVFGGIRIEDVNGELVQTTGFTYGMGMQPGEEKLIPGFKYIPLTDPAKTILEGRGAGTITFRLSEIVYEDGQTETF